MTYEEDKKGNVCRTGFIYKTIPSESESETEKEVKRFVMEAVGAYLKHQWHPAEEEPDPKRDAYILMQTGRDSFECFKYGGYNPEGGQTWAKTAKRLGWGRWCYIKDILPKEGGEE